MAAVLALMTAAMWGVGDFIAGTLTRRVRAMAVVGMSQFFGWVCITMWMLATGGWHGAFDDTGWIIWAIVASITGAAGLGLLYAALASGVMGIVSPIAALGVLVPLVAGIIAGEQPSSMQMLGVGAALIGIVLASGPELSGGAPLRPVLLAAVAAVFLGTSLLGVAKGSESNVTMLLVGMRTTTVVVMLVFALIVRSATGVTKRDVPILFAIGFFDVAANLAFGYAATLGLLTVVSVLASLYPVVTALLARFVHHERLRGVQYVGVAAAFAGISLIAGG